MINEVEGFSIIVNAHRGFEALEFLLKSLIENSDPHLNHEIIVMLDDPGWMTLKLCQEKFVNYHIVNNRCPYKTWQDGAKLATRDWLCFFSEDMYVAKGWDIGLCRCNLGAYNRGVWFSTAVQYQNSDSNNFLACKEVGRNVSEFNEEKFNAFVNEKRINDEIINSEELGWYCPFLIHRYWYTQLGGYPSCHNLARSVREKYYNQETQRCKGGCGFDNNFREIARQKGFDIHVCLDSFVFHFEESKKEPSWYKGGFM